MIRPFHPDDIDHVSRVLTSCLDPIRSKPITSDGFRRAVMQCEDWKDTHACVAENEGQVVGFAAGVSGDVTVRVPYLHVEPEYRGCRIGTQLIEKIEDLAAERESCVTLGGFVLRSPFHGVDAADSTSIAFFENRGYRQEFTATTRVLDLSKMQSNEMVACSGQKDHSCMTVSDAEPDYWRCRRDVVDLCSCCEAPFHSFAGTYEGDDLTPNNAHIAAARDDESLVGFAGFVPFEDVGLGYEAYPQWGPFLVHPGHRSRGIGRQLLTLSLAKMAELGCETAVLGGVGVDGPAAHLYEALGFTTVITWLQFQKDLERQRVRR